MLPHGCEGRGRSTPPRVWNVVPDFCAEQNMQVCVPSTPAQVYHMLRRQALRGMRRPLVVIWRNPCCVIRWRFPPRRTGERHLPASHR
ncbi:hypothetical protein ACLBR5_23570 [Escherichia coli]